MSATRSISQHLTVNRRVRREYFGDVTQHTGPCAIVGQRFEFADDERKRAHVGAVQAATNRIPLAASLDFNRGVHGGLRSGKNSCLESPPVRGATGSMNTPRTA